MTKTTEFGRDEVLSAANQKPHPLIMVEVLVVDDSYLLFLLLEIIFTLKNRINQNLGHSNPFLQQYKTIKNLV